MRCRHDKERIAGYGLKSIMIKEQTDGNFKSGEFEKGIRQGRSAR